MVTCIHQCLEITNSDLEKVLHQPKDLARLHTTVSNLKLHLNQQGDLLDPKKAEHTIKLIQLVLNSKDVTEVASTQAGSLISLLQDLSSSLTLLQIHEKHNNKRVNTVKDTGLTKK